MRHALKEEEEEEEEGGGKCRVMCCQAARGIG